MNDDRPRGFYDGMEGRLQEAFLAAGWEEILVPTTNLTCLMALGTNVEELCELLKPILFIVFWPPEGSGVCNTTKVLVQGFGDEI